MLPRRSLPYGTRNINLFASNSLSKNMILLIAIPYKLNLIKELRLDNDKNLFNLFDCYTKAQFFGLI